MNRKLTPKQVEKMVWLRQLEEPITITNLAIRFSISERTVYYYLAQWRRAANNLVPLLALKVPES